MPRVGLHPELLYSISSVVQLKLASNLQSFCLSPLCTRKACPHHTGVYLLHPLSQPASIWFCATVLGFSHTKSWRRWSDAFKSRLSLVIWATSVHQNQRGASCCYWERVSLCTLGWPQTQNSSSIRSCWTLGLRHVPLQPAELGPLGHLCAHTSHFCFQQSRNFSRLLAKKSLQDPKESTQNGSSCTFSHTR